MFCRKNRNSNRTPNVGLVSWTSIIAFVIDLFHKLCWNIKFNIRDAHTHAQLAYALHENFLAPWFVNGCVCVCAVKRVQYVIRIKKLQANKYLQNHSIYLNETWLLLDAYEFIVAVSSLFFFSFLHFCFSSLFRFASFSTLCVNRATIFRLECNHKNEQKQNWRAQLCFIRRIGIHVIFIH